MKKGLLILLVLLLVALIAIYLIISGISEKTVQENQTDETSTDVVALDNVITEHIQSKANLIVLDSPKPNEHISSPVTISGKARGYWFFEASFPFVLVDWDGRIIAQHYIMTADDWMTEEFIPFSITFEFERPDTSVSNRGALILQRDNPSGLPENDDALEIPIMFE